MTKEIVVAIHQPNFIPWLGYFHKIANCDVFILLDNVQIPKTGGSYTNRAQLSVSNEPKWVTVPIEKKYHGTKLINEIEINFREPWTEKLLRTIEVNYSRAKHFKEIYSLMESLISNVTVSLCEFNINGVLEIKKGLGLETKVVLASSIVTTETGTERLIDLTKACAGTVYLAGGGASGYQNEEAFPRAGIELRLQSFEHPVYDQGNKLFLPGLSIIDALMHLGWEESRELMCHT